MLLLLRIPDGLRLVPLSLAGLGCDSVLNAGTDSKTGVTNIASGSKSRAFDWLLLFSSSVSSGVLVASSAVAATGVRADSLLMLGASVNTGICWLAESKPAKSLLRDSQVKKPIALITTGSAQYRLREPRFLKAVLVCKLSVLENGRPTGRALLVML